MRRWTREGAQPSETHHRIQKMIERRNRDAGGPTEDVFRRQRLFRHSEDRPSANEDLVEHDPGLSLGGDRDMVIIGHRRDDGLAHPFRSRRGHPHAYGGEYLSASVDAGPRVSSRSWV